MSTRAPSSWTTGYILILTAPFIGAGLVLFDPPRWVQLTGVGVIIALVAVGTALMYRRRGGWLPSETLPPTATSTDTSPK